VQERACHGLPGKLALGDEGELAGNGRRQHGAIQIARVIDDQDDHLVRYLELRRDLERRTGEPELRLLGRPCCPRSTE
jgi:hypothetical protein